MKCDFDEEELNWNCLLIINVSLCVTWIRQVYINIQVQKTDTVFLVSYTDHRKQQINPFHLWVRLYCVAVTRLIVTTLKYKYIYIFEGDKPNRYFPCTRKYDDADDHLELNVCVCHN